MRWGPSFAGLLLLPALPILFDDPVEIAVERAFETFWPTNQGKKQL